MMIRLCMQCSNELKQQLLEFEGNPRDMLSRGCDNEMYCREQITKKCLELFAIHLLYPDYEYATREERRLNEEARLARKKIDNEIIDKAVNEWKDSRPTSPREQ